jgi:hypothetical protein
VSRSRISFLLAGLVVITAIESHAADESVDLQYGKFTAPIASPQRETFTLWDRFKVSFDQRVEDQFANRFHPLSAMNWSMDLGDGRTPHERATRAARRTLSKAVVRGAREAAVDLPIMVWLKDRQGFVADLLENSVGSVAEEEVAPLDTSYQPEERSWWGRLPEGGDVRYGIRPFRTDPYAYMSLTLRDGDDLLLLGHLRYHYRSFADHCFEVALSVPLPHGFAFDLGTSYTMGRPLDEEPVAIKLFKEFKSGSILHVGLEARSRPGLFAGITVPW